MAIPPKERWKRVGMPLKLSCERCAKDLSAVEVGATGNV
jgi:hypothetical protein